MSSLPGSTWTVAGRSAAHPVPPATLPADALAAPRAASAAETGSRAAPPPAEGLPDVAAPAGAAPGLPTDGLAALREQAREAREQLGRQPLSITNHNSRLIMKLFGG